MFQKNLNHIGIQNMKLTELTDNTIIYTLVLMYF